MSDDMTMGMDAEKKDGEEETTMPAMGGEEHTEEGAEEKKEGEEGGEAGAM